MKNKYLIIAFFGLVFLLSFVLIHKSKPPIQQVEKVVTPLVTIPTTIPEIKKSEPTSKPQNKVAVNTTPPSTTTNVQHIVPTYYDNIGCNPCTQSQAPSVERKTYTNSTYHFSVQYPSTMTYKEGKLAYGRTVDNPTPNLYKDLVYFGIPNLNGIPTSTEISVTIFPDNGSSDERTSYRNMATAQSTVQIGDDKFYRVSSAGSDGSLFLEKPTYFFVTNYEPGDSRFILNFE